MLQQLRAPAAGRPFFALAGALALVAALVPPARAADPDKSDNSLAWIPADASFYSTMLHNREQFQAFLNSKAWAKLKDLPAARMVWQMAQAQYAQPEGPLAPVRTFFEQPENKELVTLLNNAFSEEIFCYGGPSVGDFTELLMTAASAARFGPMMAQLGGQGGGGNANQAQIKAVLHALAAHSNLVKTPDFIIGFKIPDPQKALAQIKRLEGLLTGLIQQAPPLQGRLKRAKVGEADLLTLTLDGSMVPWDQVPFKDYEEKAGEFDGLVKKLKGLKLVVSLGVRNKYLMLAFGSTPEIVARLGAGGNRLIDRPEMKPLAKFADRTLTSVSYVSRELRARVNTSKKDLDNLVDMAQELAESAGLPAEKRKQIEKDAAALARDLKARTPEVGAAVSIGVMADRGFETYSYDYGEHPSTDGSRPLTLLSHVGGNPLLAAVGRHKYDPANYQLFVKWVKVAYGHADDILKDKLPAEARDRYRQFMEAFVPLFKRLDQVTGTMLLPSLADGQIGFVIDAKWSSKHWLQALPETDRALPLPELALVLGVSDADLLRKAMDQYLTLANEMIARFREVVPEANLPEIKVPRPKVTRAESGTLYSYPLPEQWGVDRQVVPTAGLSDKVAVLTLSHAAAERMLASKALKVQGGPLGNAKRPLAGAVVFNWPGWVDTIAPWVDLAVEQSGAQEKVGGENSPVGDVRKQVRTLLDVLKCYRGSTSATYFEGKVLVTHSESVFRDLK
jgi:hypothetical protein